MNDFTDFNITDRWIISCRGKKNNVDPQKPYALLVEKERTSSGAVEDVATIFLTNSECPFHCLMCDLWKNTTEKSVPEGTIPNQIEWALNHLPDVKHLKLYNSGSFFDKKAIPEKDHQKIASLISNFETVIVECHPLFINEGCLRFRDMIKSDLQIAIGLESVNTEILMKLNKHMSFEDFADSVSFLMEHDILTRAFILLRPPFLSESEGVFWAERSLDFAFSTGVECCVLIPVRAGNGAMDQLLEKGIFTLPDIHSLEQVLEYGIEQQAGRVFADVWDLKLFSKCDKCFDGRVRRLTEMNLGQKVISRIKCTCETLSGIVLL
jgi:radical SAM enzyme (TIGR01210 family)